MPQSCPSRSRCVRLVERRPNDSLTASSPSQVKGYAKKFAGQTFHNEKEKELGEAKLRGELDGPAGANDANEHQK